jgi:hypothetical protein
MEIIEGFKLLSKKLFDQEIILPKGFTKYKAALEICKNIESVNEKDKILLALFDIIFLENGVPKKEIASNLLINLKLCIEDKLNDDHLNSYIGNEKEILFSYLDNDKILTSEEMILLSFLIKIKNDFNLFFKCFEVLYAKKCSQFIPSENSERRFKSQNFNSYLKDFSLCFNMLDTKSKGYFSLVYDNKGWFITKEKSIDDYNKYKSKIGKMKINDLFDFIKKNTILKQKIQPQKVQEVKKEISVDNVELLFKEIGKLKNEIEEIKIRETKSNNTHRETINKLKNEYNRKITDLNKKANDMEIEYNKKINDLNKKTDEKLVELENKIGQLKNANCRLTDNLNKIKKDLNSIKGRGVSKTLIDFIGYVFGENNLNKKYSEKVVFINDKLDKQIKAKDKKDAKLLEELKDLINELQKKKLKQIKLPILK